MRKLLLLLLLQITFPAQCEIAGLEFESDQEEQQFRQLAAELRCLVCQNQSLSDSNAALAGDLRQELYEQVRSGQSREDIIQFMVNRYGEFILYKPRLNIRTLFLWITPVLLLLLAAPILIRFVKNLDKHDNHHISETELNEVRSILDQEQNK